MRRFLNDEPMLNARRVVNMFLSLSLSFLKLWDIRNAMICHLAVAMVLSIPCSATTAAVCRPRPRVTDRETSAVAMMLRALVNGRQRCS